MTKIKLYGIGNEGNFNNYIFDKKQDTAEKIAKIIKVIFGINWNFYEEYETKKGKWINKKIKVESFKDSHEIIDSKKDARADVFYGDKKMFIAIHCSQKDRLKFNEKLFKVALMSETKKLNKKLK